MKTISILAAGTAFTIALFLSSCSLMKEEFAQRKYYDFPRSRHSITEKQTEHTAALPAEKKTEQSVNAASNRISPEASVSVNKSPSVSQQHKAVTITKEKRKGHTAKTVSHSHSNALDPSVEFAKYPGVEKTIQNPFPASDSGAMLFIMVIAAIFLPPLGVYIKDHATSKWFWVTFLICLTAAVLGTTVFFSGWYLWFIASIIALMVVFDML